ncbi:MAG: ice-binding family protein, partial [Saprospiraceae bacterium]
MKATTSFYSRIFFIVLIITGLSAFSPKPKTINSFDFFMAGPVTVNLGTADNFAVLAGSTITNTGFTVIDGDLGLSPGLSVTGFPPGIVNGVQHIADAVALQAKTDLITAYNDAAGRTPITILTELGGTTQIPGVYNTADGTFQITGTLTLDAMGDSTAVFIFQTASTLITASASNIVLTGMAKACNVFWKVGSSATLGTNTDFVGTIMALSSITLNTNANVNGRVLARNGAVTLDDNNITKSICNLNQLRIICPPNVTINCESSTDPSNTGTAIAIDSCPTLGTIIDYSDVKIAGTCNDNYTITRTWFATNNCADTDTCEQIIFIQDTSRPSVICPINVTVNCDASNQPASTGTATANDNCTNVVTNISFNDNRINGSCNDNYLINRTWTVVDSCGNSNSCLQTVTVQDTTRPIITCPINVTVNCDASNLPPSTGTATASDNCTNVVTDISFIDNRINGSCNDNYLINRTWTVVDSCGNSNSCLQTVTVQDTTRPIITCPINVTVNCDASNQPPSTGTATASDNCTNVVTNISFINNRINGSCNDNYLINRTWTVVDSCG